MLPRIAPYSQCKAWAADFGIRKVGKGKRMDAHELLVARAAALYERHEAGRPEAFNVFSVLRSKHDEVRLHSRFLAAVLDHRSPSDGQRKNLEAFLATVANVKPFDLEGVRVERERSNIDILITNARRQAVVIENKIWAGDQEKQLQRYHETLRKQRYRSKDICLRYLTPDGRDPSKDSVGNLRYWNIAYGDAAFQAWLRECQRNAYDEPALRESIGQYLVLVQELTGTDYSEAYMNDLRNLCLENDNLVLIHDLKNAMDEAWIHLIYLLFQEIEERMRHEIKGLPEKHEVSDTSKKRIAELVTGRRYVWLGLYFVFRDEAQLGVEIDTYNRCVWYGVRCSKKKTPEEYKHIKATLDGGSDGSGWWPWWDYPNAPLNLNPRAPKREQLRLLANEDRRSECVSGLVEEVSMLWQEIKAKDLI